MQVDGFEWDKTNAIKNIIKHDTYPEEIEETFYNRHKLRKTSQNRYLLYGVTDAGRHLFVLFILKKSTRGNFIRVISARNMTKKERTYYLRK